MSHAQMTGCHIKKHWMIFFESLALGRGGIRGESTCFLIFHIIEIRVSLNTVEFIQPTWDLICKETSEENLSSILTFINNHYFTLLLNSLLHFQKLSLFLFSISKIEKA
jgi:hypothetical protein